MQAHQLHGPAGRAKRVRRAWQLAIFHPRDHDGPSPQQPATTTTKRGREREDHRASQGKASSQLRGNREQPLAQPFFPAASSSSSSLTLVCGFDCPKTSPFAAIPLVAARRVRDRA